MPHATECAANLLNNNASVLPVLPSSPIPIPGSVNSYGRSSASSHNASAVVTRTATINDISDFDPLSLQDTDKMNISFDSNFSAMFSSDETAYATTITPDPVSRNLQPSYLRDYNCCGVDHQNLVELLQHVDNYHPGLIFDMVNGAFIPFETSTVYSQDRWDPTPVSSVSTPLTTNGSAIEQKSFLQTTPSIDGNSIAQPRRSSTSTIIPSQTVTTASQNEQQYGSINISSLGHASSNNNNNIRTVVPLRRSSTSNLTSARSIATTTSQIYGPLSISIDKSKFATYIPSVTAAQYVNTVDGYHSLVGHVSSREAGPGAVSQFAKYQPIQPKAGVAMSDVYTDPALDLSGMKSSKKRTVSTSSIDAKSNKRRVTKTDESIAETSVGVMSSDLSEEVENKNETDIYPYKCLVPGCPKVYKNANGLKYHNEHGHASQSGNGAREKPWACHIAGCLKTYGSKGGLVYHVKHCHPNDLWALP